MSSQGSGPSRPGDSRPHAVTPSGPSTASASPSNVTPLRPNTRELEPPSGRRDRFLKRMPWAEILWGGALGLGIFAMFAFVFSSAWSFPSVELTWPKFWQWLILRFAAGVALFGGLRYLDKKYSNALTLSAAGSMGSESDIGSAIAGSGAFPRDAILKPKGTTEGIERLRLKEQAKSERRKAKSKPVASPPVEDKEPAENESVASAAGKKPRAAKKRKPPNRSRRR
jgi:hypothetical protein